MKKLLLLIILSCLSFLLNAEIEGSFNVSSEDYSTQFITHNNLLYKAAVNTSNALSLEITNLETSEVIYESILDYPINGDVFVTNARFIINQDEVVLYVNAFDSNEVKSVKKVDFSDITLNLIDTDLASFGTQITMLDENYAIASSADYESFLDYSVIMNDCNTINGIDDPLWFWVDDYVEGRIHSNNSFNIKRTYPNAWPEFTGFVTLSSDELSWDASPGDIDEIFLGGLRLSAHKRYLHKTEVEKTIIAPELEENDILFIDIDGTSMTRYRYQFTQDEVEVDLYNYFPLFDDNEIGEVIGSHTITLIDTIITELPNLEMINQTYYHQDNEIWIKGNISGQYVISSNKNIKIMDDITYTNTEVGEIPTTDEDHLILSSNNNIIVGYGYTDPITGERLKPNCDDVNIYATLALNMIYDEENLETIRKGYFSYEYQDPQPSYPFYHTWYPETDSAYTEPYPAVLHLSDTDNWNLNHQVGSPYMHEDYPYRNPLYPEGNPTYERGLLRTFGTQFTNRRGFSHRSGSDPSNHENNSWDLENHLWGPSSNPNGYDKEYNYVAVPDNEFFTKAFSLISANESELKTYVLDLENENIIHEITQNNPADFTNLVIHNNDYYYYSVADQILYKESNGVRESLAQIDDLVALTYTNQLVYAERSGNQIFVKTFVDGVSTQVHNFFSIHFPDLIKFINLDNNRFAILQAFVNDGNLNINIFENSSEGFSQETYVQELGIVDSPKIYFEYEVNDENLVDLRFLLKSDLTNTYFYAPIEINSTDTFDAPELTKTSLNIYPSPFSISNSRNSGTNIDFSINKSQKVSIDVYNLKGQKVNTLTNNVFDKGHHSIVWNGENSNNNVVSTGVYFVRLKTERQSMVKKVLLLK